MERNAARQERIIASLEPLLTEARVGRMRQVLACRTDHVAFVFENMVDPHNLSAVLRSMDALSFQDAHLITPGERLELSRGITIGAERWLTLHRHDSTAACLDALKAAGYRVYASLVDAGRGTPLEGIDFSRRTALVFGNEHAGVSEDVLALANESFHIPMMGFVESLNLSVAAAVSGFHARKAMEALMAEAENAAEEKKLLLPEARRRELYVEWLRRSVKKADQIIAELEQREE